MKTRIRAASRQVLEAGPALARREEALELVVGEDRLRRLGHVRRPHPGHRAGPQLALVDQPGKEALEPAVPVGRGRGAPARELIGDERLDVLAADRRDGRRCRPPGGTS